jgi:3-oxoacyl-[acyl-carrier protein] reductase
VTAPDEFEGQVALVTGGARGIGRAVVEELAGRGARVAFSYRASARPARALSAELGARGAQVRPFRSDARRPEAARDLVRAVRRWGGHLDLLVANAGVAAPGSLEGLGTTQWAQTLDTNLRAAFLLFQAAAPALRTSGGSGVIVSSVSGFLASPSYIDYHVSKAGLTMLARCLALALAPKVRVNAVAPGTVRTDMTRDEWETPAQLASTVRSTPVGRIGEPEDVAKAVAFLLSDRARFVTGQALVVDGGQSLRCAINEYSSGE